MLNLIDIKKLQSDFYWMAWTLNYCLREWVESWHRLWGLVKIHNYFYNQKYRSHWNCIAIIFDFIYCHKWDDIFFCLSMNAFISRSKMAFDFTKLFSNIYTNASKWSLVWVGIKFTLSLACPSLTTGNYMPLTWTPISIMIRETNLQTTSLPTNNGRIGQGFPNILYPFASSLFLK